MKKSSRTSIIKYSLSIINKARKKIALNIDYEKKKIPTLLRVTKL